jgi:hypothetical protein
MARPVHESNGPSPVLAGIRRRYRHAGAWSAPAAADRAPGRERDPGGPVTPGGPDLQRDAPRWLAGSQKYRSTSTALVGAAVRPRPAGRRVRKDPAHVSLGLSRPADTAPVPVGPFQRALEQVLGFRAILTGQQQRGAKQRGGPGPDKVLKRDARARAGPHTFFTTASGRRLHCGLPVMSIL